MKQLAFILAAPLAIVMAGCSSEPTFDERFEETQSRIEEKAQELDDEVDPKNDQEAPSDRPRKSAKPNR